MVGWFAVGFGLLFMIAGGLLFGSFTEILGSSSPLYALIPFFLGLVLFVQGLRGHEVSGR